MKTHFKLYFAKYRVLLSRLNDLTCLLWGAFCPQGFGGLDSLLNCYCAQRCQLARSLFQMQRHCPVKPIQSCQETNHSYSGKMEKQTCCRGRPMDLPESSLKKRFCFEDPADVPAEPPSFQSHFVFHGILIPVIQIHLHPTHPKGFVWFPTPHNIIRYPRNLTIPAASPASGVLPVPNMIQNESGAQQAEASSLVGSRVPYFLFCFQFE